MQKLEGRTFNVVQDNIEKLKELFPEIFTENKVDIDKLRLALGENVEKEKERYEFTWNGKTEAIQLSQKQTTGTLIPSKEESVNWDTTQNLYIEGDNLEVLRVLQNSYRNKVKMIYIDPPYNTGNDFVYEDDFSDNIKNYKKNIQENMKSNPETNGRYHTDWLNLMYPRLRLARNLLREDGSIFISIDDNELTNLRKLCDEVFGEENLFAQIIVQSNKRGQTYKQVSKTHEYLLIYTKKNETEFNELPKSEENSDLNLEDNIGKFNIRELRNRNPKFGKFNRPNLFYPFYVNTKNLDKDGFYPVSLEKSDEYNIEVYPFNSSGIESCWRWGKTLSNDNIQTNTLMSNLVAKRKNDGNYNIYEKYRKSTYKPKSIWDDIGFITEKGTVELGKIGLSSYFDFPKPIDLLKQALLIGTNKDDIILDFFSGSGTTAHAVMQLNSEDEGNRRFIMVQLPELMDEKSVAFKDGFKNICDVGKERIRRAGGKIVEENKDKKGIENLDIGFRVFKLDETNLKLWDEESINLEKNLLDLVEPVKEGRSQEDVVYEILLKYGIELTVPIEETKIAGKNIYFVGMGYLLICLERDLTLEHIEEMAKQKPARIVFYDEGFKDDTVRTNAQQILKRYGVEDIRVI
ncbi:site-specific DNA-methyltransferase [Exiguobacterium mexicanum]|uniref:site-specific DNA-methyltransferase n=1 Tax=Exiguobacterium mexicanum TaxID=340146 RepID=UPI00110DA614|nr:site-specific DNA-methyltransferase [Exiguobacterium mexicanum]